MVHVRWIILSQQGKQQQGLPKIACGLGLIEQNEVGCGQACSINSSS